MREWDEDTESKEELSDANHSLRRTEKFSKTSSSTRKLPAFEGSMSGRKRKRGDTESKEEISEEVPSSMSTEPTSSSSSVASSSSTRQSQRTTGVRKRKREDGPKDAESKEEISEVDHSFKTAKDLSSDATSSSSTYRSPAFERLTSDNQRRREEKRKRRKRNRQNDTESKEEMFEGTNSTISTEPIPSSVPSFSSSLPKRKEDAIERRQEAILKEAEKRDCEAKLKDIASEMEAMKKRIARLDHQMKEENDLGILKNLIEKKNELHQNDKKLSAKDKELSNKLTILRFHLEQLCQSPKHKYVHIVDFLFDLFLTLFLDDQN
jgi:hypothetical protein